MYRFGKVREWPWWVGAAPVGGLLLAILLAGLAGLLLNRSIDQATEAASYDVELEDHGDDLRVAVLDLRQYHRNLLFYEPTEARISEFEAAFASLQREIDELEELGVRSPETPQPEEFRETSRAYYSDFQPAIDRSDPEALERASDRGLQRIAEMEAAAEEIDDLAERRTEDELGAVDEASSRATALLLTVVGALLLAGAALAYLALRVVGELRRLYAEQRETSKAKTDFLADVSHELRTPLTVLRGNAEVGLALDGDWEHREILEEIVAESARMASMVEDLLLLARSDSAAVPLELEKASVPVLVEGISGRAWALARERGAELATRLAGEGEVRVDRRRVEQAVLVLVDNAIKYGSRGAAVRLSSSTESGELVVEVADRGPGIPEEELERIFDRFYRVDKARSRKMGGAGLGLPIAKTIVEAHGGNIEARSRPGEGTRMAIHLPLVHQAQPESQPAAKGNARP